MQLFYTSDIQSDHVTLHDQEAQHCAKVLRHGIGDEIHVIDGHGGLYRVQISSQDRRSVIAMIIDKMSFDKCKTLPHIAFGIIKNTTRLEWMIEKITEIGVASIQPLICQRSEKRTINTARLDKVILSAAKQSKQYHFPVLNPAVKYADYITTTVTQPAYIAHYIEGQADIWDVVKKDATSTFLIGPEGDFTEQEVALALQRGYTPINLGTSRLRAETAAMVACTHLNT